MDFVFWLRGCEKRPLSLSLVSGLIQTRRQSGRVQSSSTAQHSTASPLLKMAGVECWLAASASLNNNNEVCRLRLETPQLNSHSETHRQSCSGIWEEQSKAM